MSVPVELAELTEKVEEFGPVAYLVTVNGDRTPHVVSVSIRWDEQNRLVADVGSRSMSNVSERPDVTLLWPAPPGSAYGLIVDGRATRLTQLIGTGSANLCIDAASAVLHRTPLGDPDSPSCIRLLERR